MFKVRMKFSKTGCAKYISHLDLMHAMQRSLARAEMPVWFTEGFNQHAYISVVLPLSTGVSGECEFMDFNLMTEDVPADAVSRMNEAFPEGLKAIEIYPLSDGGMLVRDIAFCEYLITYYFDNGIPNGFLDEVSKLFDKEEILIIKKTKRKETEVNLKEFIRKMSINGEVNTVKIKVVTSAGNTNLRPEYITKAINLYCKQFNIDGASYHRLNVFNKDLKQFR